MRDTAHRQPAEQETGATRGRSTAAAATPERLGADVAAVRLPAGAVPASALHGLQRQVGNGATARLMQRAPVAAMGPGMTGGGSVAEEAAAAEPAAPAGGERQVYAVNFGGQTYRIASHELPEVLQQVGQALYEGPLAHINGTYSGVHTEYLAHVQNFRDQSVVGRTIKAVGGAEFPHQEMVAAEDAVYEARAAVMNLIHDPSLVGARTVRDALLRAEAFVNSARTALQIFVLRMNLGGEMSVAALEVTRDVSFAVAGALATAAVAPVGIGATIASGAAIEGSAALLKGLGTGAGRGMVGTARPPGETLEELAIAVAKGAALGGIGGLLKPVGDQMTVRVSAYLTRTFAGLRKSMADYVAGQVVNNVINAKISVPVDIIEFALQSDGMPDSEELVAHLAQQAARRGAEEGIKAFVPE